MLPPASQAKSTQFMKPATNRAVVSDSKVFEFTSLAKPGKTFNETSSKSITFVPSRGLKLPWQ
jgi:hypothetical protein